MRFATACAVTGLLSALCLDGERAPLRPGPFSAVEHAAFNAVNRVRAQHGLPALGWSDRVAAAARDHSYRMMELGYFSHEDPQYGGPAERLRRAGIAWLAVAENIFDENGYRDPAAAAVEGWTHSPAHLGNILAKNFTVSGIGVALQPGGTYYFTQIFVQFAGGAR